SGSSKPIGSCWARTGGDPMRLSAAIPCSLACAALLGLSLAARPASTLSQSQQVWEVQVGGDFPELALTENAYSPAVVTIHINDSVRWTAPQSVEPHTVTFTSGQPALKAFVPGESPGEWDLGPAWYTALPRTPGVHDGTELISSGSPLTDDDAFP